jgi:hypothetical protein
MKKIFTLGFLFVSMCLFCMRYPSELSGKSVADCSKPTVPDSYNPDSSGIVAEIYDFQQKLVGYDESWSRNSQYIHFGGSTELAGSIYWDGKDMNGNTLGPGEYLYKISILSKNSKNCNCSHMFITE